MSQTRHVCDLKGNDLLIFVGEYEIDWAVDKNPGLELAEFGSSEAE